MATSPPPPSPPGGRRLINISRSGPLNKEDDGSDGDDGRASKGWIPQRKNGSDFSSASAAATVRPSRWSLLFRSVALSFSGPWNGGDEKVRRGWISQVADDSDFGWFTAVEDSEDYVLITRSANNLEPWHCVSPEGSFKRKSTPWKKCGLLGTGSFGAVFEGFTDDGFFFAVKEVSLLDQGSQGKQSLSQLRQEIELYSQFEHENIVQYLGTDKDNEKLYIFLELMPKGSLSTFYDKYGLTESQVSAYTRQILNGLKYLHDQNVIHRDIKCANILVDASGSVKLSDFGLAKATNMNDAKSFKGTLFWMAPEVVNNVKNRSYGVEADIWSLGCTVLEMSTRKRPYSNLNMMQALWKIRRGEPPQVPKSLSRDAQDFICRCLQVNPNDRPSAAQLLDHPFVTKPSTSGFA
ncbi:mitogen-activated protein kinase kinase kinase 1-like [Syzygium oleosum]|uniref:mitogen-activated protein kinase kinase kinase 1-like n=1 Tax=Syzygium oleosum TaxID=219896 RepID=UPI0024BAF7F9|nr:mitogen-activated protein kinase kinase kinase 1-like [Syzygium oleosum]